MTSYITESEDRIGAILSGDANKTKEFTRGFDGHSLRCHAFFGDELKEHLDMDLDPEDPESINRIQDEAPYWRQASKPVGFLKQYGGGAGKILETVKRESGKLKLPIIVDMARANEISDKYDELYSGLAKFAEQNTRNAKRDGYITGAFGLRLRTPRIGSKDSGLASSEARSSSNAVTQSWGMITSRAMNAMQQSIEADGMTNQVRIINQIHDCNYFLIRDNVEAVSYANALVTKEMSEWHFIPGHAIGLPSELDIGPTWADQHTLKNDATKEDIQSILNTINEGAV